MALFGKFDQGYTKTGDGGLNSASGIIASIPWVRNIKIPIIGTTIVGALGYVDTAIDTFRWLVRGKFASALTVAAAGTVGTTANIVSGVGLNWGSQIATGRSVGTHARKLTEMAVGGITGVLGAKPQVLRSYTAGIGSIGGTAQAGPGRYMTQVANSRGEDPNAAYARLQSNQSEHVAALQAAQSQAGYRGL